MWKQNLCLSKFDVNVEEFGGGAKNFQRSILTNIRQDVTNKEKKANAYDISLIAPAEPNSQGSEPENTVLYDWIRDFKVEIAIGNKNTLFFAFDDKESLFCPIRSVLDLKRLGIDESAQHEAVVKRRRLNNDEDAESVNRQREISS